MSKHYIFADTHHGSEKVVKYLIKKAEKEGKISVSSTGDFANYEANNSAPPHLKGHPYVKAYKKKDKEGMAKHEKDWIEKQVLPYTTKSGKTLQELKKYLKDGKINAIMGNSDYALSSIIKKYSGKDIKEVLGGSDSAVNHITEIKTKKQGKTTFVYLPHDITILSAYKEKSYEDAKNSLKKNKEYVLKLENLIKKLKKDNPDNIVILMHESPAPEKWYDEKKATSRLPHPLRAHYDSVLEKIVENFPDKNIQVFHGHLHEPTKRYNYKTKTANLSKVKVTNLNINDIVEYDTERGTYKITKAG